MRKICLFGLILLINVTIQISGQVWEGTVAVSPVGDISDGLFAKTNAFQPGSQVEITELNSGSQVVVTIVGRIDIGNIFMLLAPQAAVAIDLKGAAVTRVSAKLIGVVQAETNSRTELSQSLDQDISPAAGIPPELQNYLDRLSSEKDVMNNEPTLITYPETTNLNPDISTPPIPLNENITESFVESPVIIDIHTLIPEEEANKNLEDSEMITTEGTEALVNPVVIEEADEEENPLPEFPIPTTQVIFDVPTYIDRKPPPENSKQFDMLDPSLESLSEKSLITESTKDAISSLTSPVVEISKPVADLSMIPNSRKMILEPTLLRPPTETSTLEESNTTIKDEPTININRPTIPGDIETLRQQQKAIELKLSELIENERIIESHLVEKTSDLDISNTTPVYSVTELETTSNSLEKETVNTLTAPPSGAKGPFFLLQLGAFSNLGSAHDRINEVPSAYNAGVIESKLISRSNSLDALRNEEIIYKVVIGPLTRDESGALLYQFRTQGFPDAFLVLYES